MSKLNKAIDWFCYFSYAHTWSLMDVIVLLVIIPFLCQTYTMWWVIAIVPWLFFSNYQSYKWNNWSE